MRHTPCEWQLRYSVHQIELRLTSNLHQCTSASINIAVSWITHKLWYQIDINLTSNWHQIDIQLKSNWHHIQIIGGVYAHRSQHLTISGYVFNIALGNQHSTGNNNQVWLLLKGGSWLSMSLQKQSTAKFMLKFHGLNVKTYAIAYTNLVYTHRIVRFVNEIMVW